MKVSPSPHERYSAPQTARHRSRQWCRHHATWGVKVLHSEWVSHVPLLLASSRPRFLVCLLSLDGTRHNGSPRWMLKVGVSQAARQCRANQLGGKPFMTAAQDWNCRLHDLRSCSHRFSRALDDTAYIPSGKNPERQNYTRKVYPLGILDILQILGPCGCKNVHTLEIKVGCFTTQHLLKGQVLTSAWTLNILSTISESFRQKNLWICHRKWVALHQLMQYCIAYTFIYKIQHTFHSF